MTNGTVHEGDVPASADRRQTLLLIGAAVLGLVLGWAGARPLSGLAAGNIVLWAVAVAGLGMSEGTPRSKAIRLGTFGFVLGLAFMCFGYEGEPALVTRLLPFALIGLFCALCAVALGGLIHFVLSAIRCRH